MKKTASKLLTEAELALMTILWRRGEGTVAEVLAELPADRDWAYTTVSTLLRILEQKKILKIRKEGRGHVYIPVLAKEDFEAHTLRHVVEKVFDHEPVALVRQLLQHSELTAEDIGAMKKLIDQAEGKKTP